MALLLWPHLSQDRRLYGLIVGWAVAPALLLAAGQLLAQPASPAAPGSAAASGSKPAAAATKPTWAELSAAQRMALEPLAPFWSTLSEGQKRKWIALSTNYPRLTPAEKATLHGRMTEWAALSPAQRNLARLNFSQTKSLTADEKKTQWEAYQALSPEERRQLSEEAQARASSAPTIARAVAPTPNKLANVPTTRSEPRDPLAPASTARLNRVAGSGPRGAGLPSSTPSTP